MQLLRVDCKLSIEPITHCPKKALAAGSAAMGPEFGFILLKG
jgi:hypothetical protein